MSIKLKLQPDQDVEKVSHFLCRLLCRQIHLFIAGDPSGPSNPCCLSPEPLLHPQQVPVVLLMFLYTQVRHRVFCQPPLLLLSRFSGCIHCYNKSWLCSSLRQRSGVAALKLFVLKFVFQMSLQHSCRQPWWLGQGWDSSQRQGMVL